MCDVRADLAGLTARLSAQRCNPEDVCALLCDSPKWRRRQREDALHARAQEEAAYFAYAVYLSIRRVARFLARCPANPSSKDMTASLYNLKKRFLDAVVRYENLQCPAAAPQFQNFQLSVASTTRRQKLYFAALTPHTGDSQAGRLVLPTLKQDWKDFSRDRILTGMTVRQGSSFSSYTDVIVWLLKELRVRKHEVNDYFYGVAANSRLDVCKYLRDRIAVLLLALKVLNRTFSGDLLHRTATRILLGDGGSGASHVVPRSRQAPPLELHIFRTGGAPWEFGMCGLSSLSFDSIQDATGEAGGGAVSATILLYSLDPVGELLKSVDGERMSEYLGLRPVTMEMAEKYVGQLESDIRESASVDGFVESLTRHMLEAPEVSPPTDVEDKILTTLSQHLNLLFVQS